MVFTTEFSLGGEVKLQIASFLLSAKSPGIQKRHPKRNGIALIAHESLNRHAKFRERADIPGLADAGDRESVDQRRRAVTNGPGTDLWQRHEDFLLVHMRCQRERRKVGFDHATAQRQADRP